MFKNVSKAWNSRTPDYLHNGTKANVIWQLKLTLMLIVFYCVKDKVQEIRNRPEIVDFPLRNTKREL